MRDLEFVKSEKAEFIYDICAGIMSIIAVLVVMMEYSQTISYKEMKVVNVFDNIVYWIFVFDYIMRFAGARDKKFFFKHNVIDLIAIIPFAYIPYFKAGSVFKLIRVITYILRVLGDIREILFTNGFIYALGIIIIITLLGSIGIYTFESGVNSQIRSFEDALWWSVVTVTTVGYGDIVILSRGGRVIACVLMLTGVGFISMLTSTMATFFFSKSRKKENSVKTISKNLESEEIDSINLSQLSAENRKNIINYYNYLLYVEDQGKKKKYT
ncbi:MAG: ion channel [Clostridium sp.]|nr:ion channel [Clostridium sp.]